MGTTDRTLRLAAQPFVAQIAGYNRSEQSDQTIDTATNLGDLGHLANDTGTPLLPLQDNMIRILRPKSGHILEAYFSLTLTTANAETNPYLKISVWKVTSATDFTTLTPDETTINAQMLQLTGTTTPYTNTAGQPIIIDSLNIISLIPQATGDINGDGVLDLSETSRLLAAGNARDSYYIEDCFTIGVHFYASNGITRITPLNTTGYKLTKFQVDMSATVVQ